MAKKKEETTEKVSKYQEALDSLNKKYGINTVLTLDSKTTGDYDVISSGSIGFDWITLGVGGFVKGKMYELMGWEGCLAEDTYIKFINVKKDGIVQDCKGGTIKNLHERFHNRTDKTVDTTFNVTSINENDRVFRNPIANVVKSGLKECFEVKTKLGYRIQATKDHKFYVGDNYLPLSDLKIGDSIFVHNNTPFTKKNKNRNRYEEVFLKWYYKGKTKLVDKYKYYRQRKHRIIFEAAQNSLNLEEYITLLEKEQSLPKDFWTIPGGYDVHHIDENVKNNDISNLQLIKCSHHARLHALERHDTLRFVAIPDKIINITSVGEKETYDIKCFFPYNNFIANGIVVHNSGKSTICGHVAAECQKKGGKVLYIDGEHAVDKTYFQALGVDTSKMLIAQPSHGEEGFQIAEGMIKSGEMDLIIIDSDSSLIPKAVLDGDIGDSSIGKKARLNSNAYPKLKTALSDNKVCLIVVSQYREKIGVMFGNPTTTQGGHALKFYTDCRIEVSKSLAKEGDVNYGNVTKVKATKNKMAPPYKLHSFDVLYGKGIDKMGEIMQLASDFEIIKKWGKTITVDDVKYTEEEFKEQLLVNEFFEELKNQIIEKIKQTDIPVVEEQTETE